MAPCMVQKSPIKMTLLDRQIGTEGKKGRAKFQLCHRLVNLEHSLILPVPLWCSLVKVGWSENLTGRVVVTKGDAEKRARTVPGSDDQRYR